MRAFALRRRRDRAGKVRQTTIQLPEEAVWDLADGQRFTTERYPGGQIVLSPAGVAVQPPVMAKAKRPPPEKVCPECGKVVDARRMRNHIAWVHRGVVPAWRKAKWR